MAQVIKTNGRIEEIAPANGRCFSLEESQKICGGYIQIIALEDGRIMIMDEEGKVKGRNQNSLATSLVRSVLRPGDYIVGDVLVCAETEFN